MQRAYTPLLRPFGLTYVQYLALLVVWEHDDQSVGEIGRRLYLDSGTLTPVLRRLEGLGYITRRRSAEDERAVRIELTPRGSALEGEMDTLRQTIATRSALEVDAFGRLREELRTLRAHLADG